MIIFEIFVRTICVKVYQYLIQESGHCIFANDEILSDAANNNLPNWNMNISQNNS